MSIKSKWIKDAIKWINLKIYNWLWFLSYGLHTK